MIIKPLTHKMKNRVREHGNAWRTVGPSIEEGRILISPVSHNENPTPYVIWVTVGKDIEIEMTLQLQGTIEK